MKTERSFPSHCPSCKMLSTVTANPHCPSPTCPWLRCTCGAVSDDAGKFMMMGAGA